MLAVGFSGTCVALNGVTGEKLWEYDAGGPVNGAAAVWDGHLVFGGCNGTLDVVRVDGTLARRVDIKIYMPNSVAVRDGLGYCGHSGNKVECYDLATGLVKMRSGKVIAKSSLVPTWPSASVARSCRSTGSPAQGCGVRS